MQAQHRNTFGTRRIVSSARFFFYCFPSSSPNAIQLTAFQSLRDQPLLFIFNVHSSSSFCLWFNLKSRSNLSLSSTVPFLHQGIGVLHPIVQSDPRYRSSNLPSPVGHIADPYNKYHRTGPHCTLCRHSRIYQDLVCDF
jgi:hypothetical protein